MGLSNSPGQVFFLQEGTPCQLYTGTHTGVSEIALRNLQPMRGQEDQAGREK
jgi:hypothetical protein